MSATFGVRATTTIARAATWGFLGWILENAAFGPRFSKAFGGSRVPFLPVYAAAGAASSFLPLSGVGTVGRFAALAGTFTAVEFAACALDRTAGGPPSWDYDPSDGSPVGGCVDVPHVLAWGALGTAALSAEDAIRRAAA
ncbi:MAG: hypothetical protein AABY22_29320 [Nanoarchaeota archaeon]